MARGKKKASPQTRAVNKEKSPGPSPTVHRTNNVQFDPSTTDNGSDYYLPPSGKKLKPSPSAGALLHAERAEITLLKSPITTIHYFIMELIWLFIDGLRFLARHHVSVVVALASLGASLYLYQLPGSHQPFVKFAEKHILWWLYWIGLGVLSSIGLGSGLHTFLIYLGPHIARVTLAAYECNSLNFPEPPYPDDVTCPESHLPGEAAVSLWAIISKVRVESLMWGVGTALGELPPYFVARSARLSGEAPDDEDYKEFLALQAANNGDKPKDVSFFDRGKIMVENIVKRTGFFGILLFASIPNPLFDFAGITCGHFLIPFRTFFGATVIGKAVIKMHIQMFCVILAFSEHHIDNLISKITLIPHIGPVIQGPLKEFFAKQKQNLHRKPGSEAHVDKSILADVVSYIVIAMIFFFLLSIVTSLAQAYHKRISDAKKKKNLQVREFACQSSQVESLIQL
uniref:Transmembrane protein 49 n=2 Tax=Panagrellus redivivus TaxID=6233 RepID=A0A7E4W3H4_PANRE